MDSLSKIIDYAERHNLPVGAVVFAAVILAIAWIGRKGAGKALSIMGGVLTAADKMLETMQKRLDSTTAALERSEALNAILHEKIKFLEGERARLEFELGKCLRDHK